MGWRLARSLDTLRDEVDKLAPGRSTRSDGTIGDDAHQARDSDHNPNDEGVVCALDLTHDPDSGADMHQIAAQVLDRDNPCLKYVIFDRRIASARSNPPWSWRDYNGSNPHTAHMHVSVGRGPDGESETPYDDTSSWGVSDLGGRTTRYEDYRHNADPGERTLKRGNAGDDVAFVQRFIGAAECGPDDGYFGPNTEAGVRWYQDMRGVGVDGIVGPVTWGELGY